MSDVREIKEVYCYDAIAYICTEDDLITFAGHIIDKIRTPATIRINARIRIRDERRYALFETNKFQCPANGCRKEKIDQIVQKIVSIADFINMSDTQHWSFTAFLIDI